MIREPMSEGKSILVVDDHPTNRLLAATLIRRLGHRVLEADNGEAALAIVERERPALVITDLLMPIIDGFELVRRLRANPELAHTKVIFWTATYRDSQAEELARIGGVLRILAKPCAPATVMLAIEHALADESPARPSGIDAGFDRVHLRLMADKLSEQEAVLLRAQRVARIAHLFSRPDGSFESWSEMLPEIAGFEESRMPRTTREWLEYVHPDHREDFRSKALAAARFGLRTELEYPFLRQDGTWVILSQVIEPEYADARSQDDARWFSTLQDVTAQKRAEEEVRRLNADLERTVQARTAELETAMKELESFDYSISHDLRAPINRIVGFAEALSADHAAALDEDGRDLVQRIERAAQQMDQLVRDLFSLSTVSRGELQRRTVDMTSLAHTIVSGLRRADPARQVSVVVEDGLVAVVDPGLVRIVLENLLNNAWKFTSRQGQARIELGWERASDPPVFFVRDNGAGFDPGQADRLFVPFQRLHPKADYDGTGIGLATVRRIVSRHGGRVWAEGGVGAGATIRFTLWK